MRAELVVVDGYGRSDVGFLSERKARRETAETQALAAREARAREARLSLDELVQEWCDVLSASGVDRTDLRSVVDASGGCVFRPSFEASATFIDRGVVLVTGPGELVLAFRALAPGDAVPPPIEVIVRSLTEIREPRQKEDRSFLIVFERDGLFRPPNSLMRGDAWELRHPNPDELYRHFSSVGLPW